MLLTKSGVMGVNSRFNTSNSKLNSLNHKSNSSQKISDDQDKDRQNIGRNEQTVSGSVHQISHSRTAYDRETNDPHQEILEMKRKNNQVIKKRNPV